MRRYGELSKDQEPLLPHQFCSDCIIATPGYDFREGQVCPGRTRIVLNSRRGARPLQVYEASIPPAPKRTTVAPPQWRVPGGGRGVLGLMGPVRVPRSQVRHGLFPHAHPATDGQQVLGANLNCSESSAHGGKKSNPLGTAAWHPPCQVAMLTRRERAVKGPRRSLFVNWTRPRIFRCSTISCCLSAAFSASSRLLDLKIEPPRLKRKNISAAIAADVKRFYQQIKTDDVFGTHRGNLRWLA